MSACKVDESTVSKHAAKNAVYCNGKIVIPTLKLTAGDNGLGTYAY